ncbi:hypothetical protein D3C72_1900750 [compost metagenome]
MVPNDRDYVAQRLREAFATRGAAQLEALLSDAGVPAAKVRKLEEFLQEVDETGCVNLPDHRFRQDGREVRTRGFGFACAQEGGPTAAGAPAVGEGGRAVLAGAGLDDEAIAELERAGIIRTQAKATAPAAY